jgi:hypothetical protein
MAKGTVSFFSALTFDIERSNIGPDLAANFAMRACDAQVEPDAP